MHMLKLLLIACLLELSRSSSNQYEPCDNNDFHENSIPDDQDFIIHYNHGKYKPSKKRRVIDHDHGTEHYDNFFLHHHNHVYKLDSSDIKDQLLNNNQALNEIRQLVNHNSVENQNQSQILQANKELIQKQIELQKQDAERDFSQMEKQDQAEEQRMGIKESVDKNGMKLDNLHKGQGFIYSGQKKLREKVDSISNDVQSVASRIDNNAQSLDNLHFKLDEHKADFKEFAANSNGNNLNGNESIEKLNKIHEKFLEQNDNQQQILTQVLTNQEKINELNEGQQNSNEILNAHVADMDHHVKNMSEFANGQLDFNQQSAIHMENVDCHMQNEEKHMKHQKKHMKMQKTHMEMEALHMANADKHFSQSGDVNVYHHHKHKHHFDKNGKTQSIGEIMLPGENADQSQDQDLEISEDQFQILSQDQDQGQAGSESHNQDMYYEKKFGQSENHQNYVGESRG